MPTTEGDIHDSELGLWIGQQFLSGGGTNGYILDWQDTFGLFAKCAVLRVESRSTTAQPGTAPTSVKVWLLPASPTGTDWSGQGGKLAIYAPNRATWYFPSPTAGRVIIVADESYKAFQYD